MTQLAEDSDGLPTNLVDELASHWRQVAAAEDAKPETLRLASQFCMLQDRLDESVALMEKAAAKDNRYTDALIDQYARSGSDKKAKELANRLARDYESKLADDSSDVVSRIRFARLLAGTDQLEEAEVLLRAAPEPKAPVKTELARVLQRKARTFSPADQVPILHEALQLAPGNTNVLEKVAALAADVEQGESSRRVILDLTVDGRLPVAIAYAALGTALLDVEEYEKAEADLRKSTQLAKRNPLSWNNLAVCLIRKANPDPGLAIECSKVALKLLPDHETLLATYGEALLAVGQSADAIRVLQRAVGMGKKTQAIHRHLAIAHAKLGNDELVEKHRAMAERLAADD